MAKRNIQMVDLKAQYQSLETEINTAVKEVMAATAFIGGQCVRDFQNQLSTYLNKVEVVPCANGTDALQIALMAIGAKAGDEIILPAFTYVATAEVIALLGLTPVMVDIDPLTFNIDTACIESYITDKTKAIVPVHLFGQCCNMDSIMDIAHRHQLSVIEDNAQSLGAYYLSNDGSEKPAGTIGHIGTTSFYPSKVLGAYGDGGALFSNDIETADLLRKIANHGQSSKYYHDIVGCNSRLDAIQAAILSIKLNELDRYLSNRVVSADIYDSGFESIDQIITPFRDPKSTHVFHQYTIRVKDGKRDSLKAYLADRDIPSMIYYPLSLHQQKAYISYAHKNIDLKNTIEACSEVLSLPICPELKESDQSLIIDSIKAFYA
ncbi:DegT/DnrJ/EryC1/StrS family aminotransferase [Saprospiraceae bacterium]|nr:DegT/DnrJ/EryC1/StrS family aminotransferase [Saprospiraceae bacterium]